MGLKVLGPVVGSPLESGFGTMEALWREIEIQFGVVSQVLAWSPKDELSMKVHTFSPSSWVVKAGKF